MSSSSTPNIPLLPVELYRTILQHTHSHGRSTWHSILLTCHLFRLEIEPVLYEFLDTKDFGSRRQRYYDGVGIVDPGVVGSARYLSLLTSLKNNKRAAESVRHFVSRRDWRIGATDKPESWELLEDALANLVNLKTFVFGTENYTPAGRLLRKCSFHLDTFEWLGYHDEDMLLPFLYHQASLNSLSVMWRNNRPVPSDVVSNITSFGGTFHALQAFVPGRPVKALSWARRQIDDRWSDIAPLIPSMEALETLKLSGGETRQGLRDMVPHLKNVRHLHLEYLQAEDFRLLIAISSLEQLTLVMPPRRELSTDYYELQKLDDDPNDSQTTIFHELPSLQVVNVRRSSGLEHQYKRPRRPSAMIQF